MCKYQIITLEPETNVISHVNYTSIYKKNKIKNRRKRIKY